MKNLAYSQQLVSQATSSGGNNCLLHSILPYITPHLIADAEFREQFTKYWQLNQNIADKEFQQKLCSLVGSVSDLEKLLGPVLRQFLADQLRQAYRHYQQDSISEISLGYDKRLTVDKILTGDSNPFRNTDDESLQRQFGMSECVANFLSAAKGFHDSFAGNDPTPNNVDDFDDYINQLERGNVFISLGDISLLARRYNLEFDWFSPSRSYEAAINGEQSTQNQRIIVWYNGINHFEYCPNQGSASILEPNKPAQLKDEQGYTYNSYSKIQNFVQSRFSQIKQDPQSQHALDSTNTSPNNDQRHVSSIKMIANELNERLSSSDNTKDKASLGNFEEEYSLEKDITQNYVTIRKDYKALRDIWYQRSDLQSLEKQTNNYSIIEGFFSHNTVVGEGADETITMTNEQSVPTNNTSKQEETQVQKDYYIALAEQLKEVANGLSEAEEQLEHNSMPGPKK